jgi:hypothetical protein
MRTDWVSILTMVIFISIVFTLILAVLSYFAYKVRDSRRPRTEEELRREGESNVYYPPTAASGSATDRSSTAAQRR